jgi:hypothetical protein
MKCYIENVPCYHIGILSELLQILDVLSALLFFWLLIKKKTNWIFCVQEELEKLEKIENASAGCKE